MLTTPAVQCCHRCVPDFAQDTAGRENSGVCLIFGRKESLLIVAAANLRSNVKGLRSRAPGVFFPLSRIQSNLSTRRSSLRLPLPTRENCHCPSHCAAPVLMTTPRAPGWAAGSRASPSLRALGCQVMSFRRVMGARASQE